MFKKFLFFILFIISFPVHANLAVIDIAAVTQLIHQLSQLKQQTLYIQQELQGLKSGQFHWGNAQRLIDDLALVVKQKNSIAYSASDINEKFQKNYPGYKAPQNFSESYQNNVNTTQDTLNGVLQSMSSSAKDFQNENARLAFLQKQSESAKGQTQAIQASSQIASEMVSQIELLRQVMIAQSNAQNTYYATQIQNEANAKADLSKIIQAGSTDIPEYGSSGNYLSAFDLS